MKIPRQYIWTYDGPGAGWTTELLRKCLVGDKILNLAHNADVSRSELDQVFDRGERLVVSA